MKIVNIVVFVNLMTLNINIVQNYQNIINQKAKLLLTIKTFQKTNIQSYNKEMFKYNQEQNLEILYLMTIIQKFIKVVIHMLKYLKIS